MKENDLKDGDRISAADYQKYFLNSDGKKKTKKQGRITLKTSGPGKNVSSDEVRNAVKTNGRESKFNAKVTYVDNIRFDSRWEAKRYSILKIRESAGEIKDLRLQVPYDIVINEILITKYIADFVYFDKDKNAEIVEDSKGFLTPEYKIKRSLMKAVLGIEIFETREMKKPYRRKTSQK